jgi:hypothetical protein
VIELSLEDRAVLEQRSRAYTGPHHVVTRAKIVQLAARGVGELKEGLDGLRDRPRSGRPRAFSPVAVVAVVRRCR